MNFRRLKSEKWCSEMSGQSIQPVLNLQHFYTTSTYYYNILRRITTFPAKGQICCRQHHVSWHQPHSMSKHAMSKLSRHVFNFRMQQVGVYMVYFMILYCLHTSLYLLPSGKSCWPNINKTEVPQFKEFQTKWSKFPKWSMHLQVTAKSSGSVLSFQQPNQPHRLGAGPTHKLSQQYEGSGKCTELMTMKEVMTNTWEVINFQIGVLDRMRSMNNWWNHPQKRRKMMENEKIHQSWFSSPGFTCFATSATQVRLQKAIRNRGTPKR